MTQKYFILNCPTFQIFLFIVSLILFLSFLDMKKCNFVYQSVRKMYIIFVFLEYSENHVNTFSRAETTERQQEMFAVTYAEDLWFS